MPTRARLDAYTPVLVNDNHFVALGHFNCRQSTERPFHRGGWQVALKKSDAGSHWPGAAASDGVPMRPNGTGGTRATAKS
jgi:hypothetical protein